MGKRPGFQSLLIYKYLSWCLEVKQNSYSKIDKHKSVKKNNHERKMQCFSEAATILKNSRHIRFSGVKRVLFFI